MPHVIGPNGKDLGDITDRRLLAYYRGEGYQIGDPKPAKKPAAKPQQEPQTSPAEEPSHSPEETA